MVRGSVFIEHPHDYFCDRCRIRIPAGDSIAVFPRSDKGFCEECAEKLQQKWSDASVVRNDQRRRELSGVWEWQFDHPPQWLDHCGLRWLWTRKVNRDRRKALLGRRGVMVRGLDGRTHRMDLWG
jgi:hypothetical protein